jgi:Zn-dependent peptidase ImmA (M78 family)
MADASNAFDVAERYWAKGPPVNIQGIIRDLGIEYAEELRPAAISGLIEKYGDGYRIVVNASQGLVRRRFTAAHELGHYVYHRELIGDGIVDDPAYKTTDVGGRYKNPKILLEHETQANRFAAIVLMPSALIQRLQEERQLDFANPRDVKDLARLLEVSEQALRIRLKLD